jgi:F-type H+-transporting ATPase subunit epsilon
MAQTLRLEIITPEAVAYSGDAELVTLPGIEGQLGIYPMHVPVMTQMQPGELIVRQNGSDHSFAVGEGLVEIAGDHVSILTVMAVATEQIDETKIEEARQRAEARLKEKLSDEEVASVNAALAHLAQLHIKRRQHH